VELGGEPPDIDEEFDQNYFEKRLDIIRVLAWARADVKILRELCRQESLDVEDAQLIEVDGDLNYASHGQGEKVTIDGQYNHSQEPMTIETWIQSVLDAQTPKEPSPPTTSQIQATILSLPTQSPVDLGRRLPNTISSLGQLPTLSSAGTASFSKSAPSSLASWTEMEDHKMLLLPTFGTPTNMSY
jgi:hypothetical protein